MTGLPLFWDTVFVALASLHAFSWADSKFDKTEIAHQRTLALSLVIFSILIDAPPYS